MSHGSSGRPGRNERRAAARDKARALREQQKKRDRRNRVLLQSGIGVAIVAVLAIVAVVIVTSIQPPVPGPKNMASDGIVLTKGLKVDPSPSLRPSEKPIATRSSKNDSTVHIVTYVDYLCPYCGQFEATNNAQIARLVRSGSATVEIHPIAILTSHSNGTKYSLRAANAAACVANYSPNSFWDFHAALFRHQPEEGSDGLTDQQLKRAVTTSGAKDSAQIDRCIAAGTYEPWVESATNRALEGPIPNSSIKALTETPLVLVNGKHYNGSLKQASQFRQFILQAQSADYQVGSPSSTPTPTPTPTAAG